MGLGLRDEFLHSVCFACDCATLGGSVGDVRAEVST